MGLAQSGEVNRNSQISHRTFFSVVGSEADVDSLVAVTETVVEDLDKPRTGVLFVVPVSRVYGVAEAEPGLRQEG